MSVTAQSAAAKSQKSLLRSYYGVASTTAVQLNSPKALEKGAPNKSLTSSQGYSRSSLNLAQSFSSASWGE